MAKMRGARPTPRHRLLAATPHPQPVVPPTPTAWVPEQISIWGNSTYGDCVSAEEAFNKATAKPEMFVSDNIVTDWADKHGFLNGAGLTEVMDQMRDDGFKVGNDLLTDGPYNGVDYSNELTLQSALTLGPVKIAIDADALPGTAGQGNGWHALGGPTRTNYDHCVSIAGFGSAEWLYEQLGVPLPPELSGKSGYLLFTWNSIGFVDYDWLMSTCCEAWVRKPSNVKNGVKV